MRVVYTRGYLRELDEIGRYIGERNPRAATRVVNEIHSRTADLPRSNPFIGRVGTLELVVPGTPYIVAYRVTDRRVEIMIIQHGAREWPDDF